MSPCAAATPARRNSPTTWPRTAAVDGWSASAPLAGSPSALATELAAIEPAFATVLFGTNDIERNNIDGYAGDMTALVDALLDAGVIPILSTMPPRDDSTTADAQVPRYGLVVRAIAEARQVPFLDLEPRLRALADHGIGPDGVHLERDARGACVLDATGLGHGDNLRNLLTLEALDRLRRAVVDGGAAPDADNPPRPGSGTAADPFLVDALPFTDVRDTSTSPSDAVDTWAACGAQDESGPEHFYRLELAGAARVHALVLDRGSVDVDVHHVDELGTCTARNDREIVVDLAAGSHTFVFDTFAGAAQAGEHVVIVYAE